MTDVTRILSQIESGDASASEKLLPLVYQELRGLAARKLADERAGLTLQATALVHEAYLRLVDNEHQQRWNSQGHFFAAAAEAMRRILVENARRKGRQKRGGGRRRVNVNEATITASVPDDELLAVDEALEKLAKEDPSAAQVVKLRYFAGLSVEEAAQGLGISRAQAYRHWTYAKAWLRCELQADENREQEESS